MERESPFFLLTGQHHWLTFHGIKVYTTVLVIHATSPIKQQKNQDIAASLKLPRLNIEEVKGLLHWWNGSVTVLGLSPHGSAGFSFSCSFWLVTTFSDFGQCTNIYISHQMALIFGMTWPKQGEHQLLEPERAKQRPASAQPGTSAGKRQVDLYFNSRSPCFWISKNNNRLTTCRTSLKL